MASLSPLVVGRRVALVLIAGVVPASSTAAQPGATVEPAYAAFRVVKATPGEPGRPEVVLPAGYELVTGERYQVASRAEYYAFVRGPADERGVVVTVRWPGETIHAVIGANERLELERAAADPYAVTFRLPVVAVSPEADQSTIQVWSHMPTAPGIRWRIEHNDPDRAAGPWAEVDWPAGEARAVIHYLVAAERILRDSGLAEAAHARGHFIALMGFETNNTLHPDNPPHWHLSYYAGNSYRAPAYLPHFWVDPAGRTFYNGMDVTGQGRQRYHAGDRAPMHDFAGNLVLTTTIREDGGLDIEPAEGHAYSIIPGPDGAFTDEVRVLRGDLPWLRVLARDDVRAGALTIRVVDGREPGHGRTTVHVYDRLTGAMLGSRTDPISNDRPDWSFAPGARVRPARYRRPPRRVRLQA